jgi:iron complex outermembrane receptor protein
VQSFEAEIIKQVETGFKFSGNRIAGTAAIYPTLSNRRNVNLINGPAPGSAPQEVINIISSRSYGAEATLTVRLNDWLSFDSNATYEDDKYTQYTPVAACIDCVGNDLQRQPIWMANAGLSARGYGLDAALYDTFTGRTFTSDLNNILLPSYNIFRLDAGYSRTFSGGDRARIGISVYNLFDSHAVTEGSPRQGTLQNAGAAYFIGREVLPRRVLARLTYNF